MPAKRVADRTGSRAIAEAKSKVVKRQLQQEREFPFTAIYTFHSLAHQTYELVKLMAPKEDGNLQIVQEFYAHACVYPVWRFSIRGAQVDFTLPSFRLFTSLPEVENCKYQEHLANEDDIPEDAISKMLTYDGTVAWDTRGGSMKYLLRTQLSVEARVWLHFGKEYFWPSSNRARLTRDQALLIYLLMNKESVDLGAIIHKSLKDRVHEHNDGLVLPHLISAFCTSVGVPALATDVMFKPILKFRYQTIRPRPNEQVPANQRAADDPFFTGGEPSQSHPEEGEPSDIPSSSQPPATLDLIYSAIQRTEATAAQCLSHLQDHGVRLTRLEDLYATLVPGAAHVGDDDGDDGGDDDDDDGAAGGEAGED